MVEALKRSVFGSPGKPLNLETLNPTDPFLVATPKGTL